MRNQQNETGQTSLFALDYSRKREVYSVPTAPLYSPAREAERLAGNLLELRSLSRSADPKTSKIAAEKAVTFKQTHIDRIYESLKENGKMNFQEIAEKAGMRADQVWRRRKEMVDGGWIEVLEETRNGCALWVAK
jgi:CRP-like cAMP-binding protein